MKRFSSRGLALAIIPLLSLLSPSRPGAVRADPNQSTFIDSGQALGGNVESSEAALGDIDGDGDLDALVASYVGPSKVYVNQGGAQGGTPGIFLDSGQNLGAGAAVDVALADLDGDTDLDAFIVRDAFGDSNEVWINNGVNSGSFIQTVQVFGDSLSTSVALGDLDGDDDLDAFIGRGFGQPSKVWLNDGAAFFIDSGQALDTDSVDLALGDVDGDGDLDAFSANGTADKVWINLGGVQGGAEGDFLDSGQSLGAGLALAVALGDVDGDGDLDAFLGNSSTDRVWTNQGGAQGGTEGEFQDSGQALSTGQTRDLGLHDLDGDGDLDAFLAKGGGNQVWVNQGGAQGGTEGDFLDSGQSLGDLLTEGVDLGDVDGDDDLDVFAANWGAPDQVWLNQAGAPPPGPGEGWQYQTVDVRGLIGYHPALALALDGTPHVSYWQQRPGDESLDWLFHASWDGVRWQTTAVEAYPGFHVPDGYTAIDVDVNGDPHIVYAAMDENGISMLYYAQWNDFEFLISPVPGSEGAGNKAAMVLDVTGSPHISFGLDDDEALGYAHWNGNTWTVESVDPAVGSNLFSDIGLDTIGQPHISYAAAGESLKHAYHDGNTWQLEEVDPSGSSRPYNAIDFTASGDPTIAYLTSFSNRLRLATWDGTSWLIELVREAPFEHNFTRLSLALDSNGDPQIVYGLHNTLDFTIDLVQSTRAGAVWTQEILDNHGRRPGESSAMVLDGDDRIQVAYQEGGYGDLRFLSWRPNWQTMPVFDPGSIESPSIDLHKDTPSIGFYNLPSGQVRLAEWLGIWVFSNAAIVGPPTQHVAHATGFPKDFLAYYDPLGMDLILAQRSVITWTEEPLNTTSDVGRYVDLVMIGSAGNLLRLAHWDAINFRVKAIAIGGVMFPRETYTNMNSPPLNADSGYTHVTVLPDNDVGVSYYDGVSDDLRFARLDIENGSGTWFDELVDGSGDVGRLNDIATDGTDGFPVIAYYDATNDAIKLAVKDGGWQIQTAVPDAGGVTSLSLELGLNARERARIAYTTADNTLHVALLIDGVFEVQTVLLGAASLDQADLALGDRAHLAFRYGGALHHAVQSASLDVDTSAPFGNPHTPAGYYNPLDSCMAVLDFFTGDSSSTNHRDPAGPALLQTPYGALDDLDVFERMTQAFSGSPGGQFYIDLYAQHGSEMGRLGLDDPALLGDAYGTLQNFIPGLEAFVTGRGGEWEITQEMVDDALDIWQRLAAAGSPELAGAINTELAKYNDLQDFVGMTFDEWAAALGVSPPAAIFLPVVQNGGP